MNFLVYVAVYNFVAKDGHQLSLQFGDLVQIVERCPGERMIRHTLVCALVKIATCTKLFVG